MDDLKIAAVCMHVAAYDIERNLDCIRSYVNKASASGADIVCFPELSITGYVLKRPAAVYGTITQKEVISQLELMAREANLVIIAGLIDIQDGLKPRIAQIVVGQQGIIGIYHKTHLSPPENDTFQAGQEFRVFSFGNTTFGLQLCYESHFPEISTILSLMGAEILFIPHASPLKTPEDKLKSWMRHLPGRAFDNGVFVVVCNQVGETDEGLSFPGVSLVLGPDGQIIDRYEGMEENILVVPLKADALDQVRKHRMKYFIPRRRPSLYKKLLDPCSCKFVPLVNGYKKKV